MSPELETLDQLLGGSLQLAVIRGLYSDDFAFARGIHGLLAAGDVRLSDGATEVPQWQWGQALAGDLAGLRLDITSAGSRRIA